MPAKGAGRAPPLLCGCRLSVVSSHTRAGHRSRGPPGRPCRPARTHRPRRCSPDPGVQPAVAQHLGAQACTVVAAHHHRAAAHDLPALPRTQRRPTSSTTPTTSPGVACRACPACGTGCPGGPSGCRRYSRAARIQISSAPGKLSASSRLAVIARRTLRTSTLRTLRIARRRGAAALEQQTDRVARRQVGDAVVLDGRDPPSASSRPRIATAPESGATAPPARRPPRRSAGGSRARRLGSSPRPPLTAALATRWRGSAAPRAALVGCRRVGVEAMSCTPRTPPFARVDATARGRPGRATASGSGRARSAAPRRAHSRAPPPARVLSCTASVRMIASAPDPPARAGAISTAWHSRRARCRASSTTPGVLVITCATQAPAGVARTRSVGGRGGEIGDPRARQAAVTTRAPDIGRACRLVTSPRRSEQQASWWPGAYQLPGGHAFTTGRLIVKRRRACAAASTSPNARCARRNRAYRGAQRPRSRGLSRLYRHARAAVAAARRAPAGIRSRRHQLRNS